MCCFHGDECDCLEKTPLTNLFPGRKTMKEYLTLYDENGRDTGFVQQRGTGACPGAYYQVVSIFTQDEAGLLLAARRSGQKVSFPHCWEVTGGCVQAGEDSHSAAARELEEETGLVPWKMEHLGSFSTPTFSGGAFSGWRYMGPGCGGWPLP